MSEKTKKDIEEELKKKFPGFKHVEKINDAKHGEKVIITGKIKSDAIKLSPPIQFVSSEKDKSKEITYLNEIFEIKKGFLYKHTNGLKSFSNHADEYNLIISGFNIIGLPFDYVSTADITTFGEDKAKKSFEAPMSDKARRRGVDIPVVEINEDEYIGIDLTYKEITERLKANKIDGLEDIFKFFGYANYYLFHNDINLTFINSWMFIEPYVNSLWSKAIKETFKGLKYSPNNGKGNWTLQQKIDELYMMNKILPDTREALQEMRNKRNKVFHVDDNPIKRKVELRDALKCYRLARRLFCKMLGFEEGVIFGNHKVNDVRYRMGIAIFGEAYKYNSMTI